MPVEGTDVLSLSDKLASVELGNHTLQHFVHNGWKYTLVIVQTEFTVDGGKLLDAGSREDTACNVDHLQV